MCQALFKYFTFIHPHSNSMGYYYYLQFTHEETEQVCRARNCWVWNSNPESLFLEVILHHYSNKIRKQMGIFTLIICGDTLSASKKLEENTQK